MNAQWLITIIVLDLFGLNNFCIKKMIFLSFYSIMR
jgi:hypothetical protein